MNIATDVSYEESPSELNEVDVNFSAFLKSVVGIFNRNRVLIAAITLSIVATGAVVTLLITPKYQASAQILIEDQADQIIEGSDLQESVSGAEAERFLQTQIGLIKSRALARNVVDAGKLARSSEFFEDFGASMPVEVSQPGRKLSDEAEDLAIDLLLKNLDVTIPVDSRIAQITITSRNPQRSAALANLYADRFINYNLGQKYNSSSYARQFLASQLDDVRYKLTHSELDLNRYARAAGLIRVGGQGGDAADSALSVTNNQLIQLNSSAAAATADRIQAEDRWKAIANLPPLSISEVNTNPAVMQLLTAKASAESDLADELSRHLDGHPTVTAKRAKVAELDKRLNLIANSIKASVKVNYEAARDKADSLLGEVKSLSKDALNEQDRGVQYQVLKREADTNRALYDSLLSRYNQLNASAGASSNNITVVDHAVAPKVPSSPNLPLNLAISFVLGLVVAAVVALLKDLFDDAIRSPADVEKKLGLPMLGLIPTGKNVNVKEEFADRRSSISEAYLSLVTNLSYSTPSGMPSVLAVTSAYEGEGKSTTAWAIAINMAMLGKRTLLVDCDLRRPTLHRTMSDERKSGLTDFLIGEKTFDEVVHMAPGDSGLNYVTGLPMPPDPGLILASAGLGGFVEEARSRFDVVVLDCPPLLGLTDVPLISKYADGLLFVVDASSFKRGAVKSAMRRIAMAKGRVLGVVLNRFRPTVGSDDYAYYGYNYYSYGQGES